MKFSLATAVILVSGAVAQLPPGLSLPADIRGYADSLSDNPAALQALVGIFTASQVQNAVLAAQTLTGAAVAQTFAAAVQQAIAAEPSSLQTIAASEVNRIAPYALTDGLLAAGGSAVTSAVVGATSGAANATNATSTASGAVAGNGTLASASSSAASVLSSAASRLASSASASAASAASRSAGGSATGAGTAATTTAAGSLGNSVGALSGVSGALLAGGAFVVALL